MVRYNADFMQSSDEDQEEKQNSNKEEVANIATRSNSVEELLAKLTETERSSYTRIYSRTRVELTTIDYTWTIEKFMYFSASVCTLLSPPFAEDNQYSIQMNISRPADSPLNTTQFYMRTNTELTGSCTTTVKCCSDTVLVTKSISGCIRDMTLLIEIWNYAYVCVETLTVECKFVFFHEAISNSINMNLLPPPVIYKCVKRSEDSNLEGSTEERGKFKFVVGDKSYLIPKHLLRAINSAYFNNVCLTLNENEKDITNELTECELQSFKQMLAFILTGSVGTYDYDMLKNLLMTADKYGVTSLKLACQHCLLCCITTKNAIELLQLALSCTAAVLEEHSAAFIKFHMKEMNSEEFESLPPEDLNKIMNPIEKCHIPEISTRNFCYREK
ncbi:PREDICTED: uncharacterized protein LOC105560916 [Vollenhovia emeryi]|uniref:uncharacterized protein LOC105560916 n=1 Tax=Vollenhovia emeryi TaxID=411798 RepID=UPI0005F49058|nr:PREDICTED: uncharacterized protein LOC105560916 [Vollenhovia emeryi]